MLPLVRDVYLKLHHSFAEMLTSAPSAPMYIFYAALITAWLFGLAGVLLALIMLLGLITRDRHVAVASNTHRLGFPTGTKSEARTFFDRLSLC